jgi:uncharacterized membrane protein
MSENTDEGVVVIVAAYSVKDDAELALKQIEGMTKEDAIVLMEAAAIYKNPDGKIFVTDTAGLGAGKGAKRGLIVGGVVGLLFPPSIVIGALGGGAAGALYGHFRDKGISNKDLEQAGADLQTGQYGLVTVVTESYANRVKEGLASCEKLDSYALDPESSKTVLTSHRDSSQNPADPDT